MERVERVDGWRVGVGGEGGEMERVERVERVEWVEWVEWVGEGGEVVGGSSGSLDCAESDN